MAMKAVTTKKTRAVSRQPMGRVSGSMVEILRGGVRWDVMELALAAPERLHAFWSWAARFDAATRPDAVRKRRIDAVLLERGLFAKMAAASRAARTREFRDRLEAARAEREAARNEADLARLCERILTEMGADMADLQVRLRRRTAKELRAEGKPRQAAGIAMRITPTLEAARAAVAEADGQPGSESLASEISDTDAPDGSGADEQAGQATSSG